MPLVRLHTADDPRIDDYRVVSEPALARERGLFVAEGREVVSRLLKDRRYEVRSVLVTETARAALSAALACLPPHVPIYVATPADVRAVAGIAIHRGCLALGVRRTRGCADDVIATGRMVLVLDGVANADNVGGIFRNAAAFGADGVLLSPTSCDPLYRKAIRTSMAATLRVPFDTLTPWPEALDRLRDRGYALVAVTPRAPSITLESFVARGRLGRLALLFGSEDVGLTPAVEARVDVRVRIPIEPEVDSLNVAVTAGIVLSRLRAVSRPTTEGRLDGTVAE